MNKSAQIQSLKSEIESRLFKINASRLRMKYAKSNAEAVLIGFEVIKLSMEVKMLYVQIQTIQASPIYPKGGIAICGNKQKEVILRR